MTLADMPGFMEFLFPPPGPTWEEEQAEHRRIVAEILAASDLRLARLYREFRTAVWASLRTQRRHPRPRVLVGHRQALPLEGR